MLQLLNGVVNGTSWDYGTSVYEWFSFTDDSVSNMLLKDVSIDAFKLPF